ncbi:MAG TPA: hypothetical protein VMT34_02825 [Aggregatilineales bacterium]|nr:hypothetical protein [Aggregatilineales bacterium]
MDDNRLTVTGFLAQVGRRLAVLLHPLEMVRQKRAGGQSGPNREDPFELPLVQMKDHDVFPYTPLGQNQAPYKPDSPYTLYDNPYSSPTGEGHESDENTSAPLKHDNRPDR